MINFVLSCSEIEEKLSIQNHKALEGFSRRQSEN